MYFPKDKVLGQSGKIVETGPVIVQSDPFVSSKEGLDIRGTIRVWVL